MDAGDAPGDVPLADRITDSPEVRDVTPPSDEPVAPPLPDVPPIESIPIAPYDPNIDAPECAVIRLRSEHELDHGPDARRCVPGTRSSCRCQGGGAGFEACSLFGWMSPCLCVADVPRLSSPKNPPNGVVVWPGYQHVLPPRLVRPISNMKVMSQRPTLRWALPTGITRARVELCRDRACTQRITQADVTGTSWRPAERLSPGVVFWRVSGLDGRGAVTWTSATWTFGVRQRDTSVDVMGAMIRDFNGDGIDDGVRNDHLIVGARGAVRMRSGPTIDTPVLPEGNPILFEQFGDVNGDGRTDLVLRYWLLDFSNLRTLLGTPRCALREEGFVPDMPRDAKGGFVGTHALGDFNGDGFSDALVVSDLSFFRVSTAYLFLGSPSGLAHVPASYIDLGAGFSGGATGNSYNVFVGDLDGDGYGDFALSDILFDNRAGYVRIIYGNPSARIEARTQSFYPPELGFSFGSGFGTLDFNQDGYSDLATGSFLGIHLFAGGPDGLRLERVVRQQYGVAAAQEAMDFDGDGLLDLRFDGIFSLGRSFFRGGPDFLLRAAVSEGGDFNADGFDDVITYPPRLCTTLVLGAAQPFRFAAAQWHCILEER